MISRSQGETEFSLHLVDFDVGTPKTNIGFLETRISRGQCRLNCGDLDGMSLAPPAPRSHLRRYRGRP